jgi:hypothetical protein
MVKLSDTAPEAERVLREVFRRMPFERKWRQMGATYHTAWVLHAAGFRARHPTATEAELWSAWGALLPEGATPVRQPDDNLRVLQEVIAALSGLGIVLALGGSWASSLLGKMRFTRDADLNVEPFPGKKEAFCACFGEDYYVSLPEVQQAIRLRSSFNLLHTVSGFKVDLFVRKDRPFDQSVLDRRRPFVLPDTPGQTVQCVSAEDVILLKLEWYRLGGESSQQQWLDVQGVLEVQGPQLDRAYLEQWAAELGVTDLLARALQESGA